MMMFRPIAILSLAAVAGCIPQGSHVLDAVEKMPVPQCESEDPVERARPCGTPFVWDFTKGMPVGGNLRKGGCASPDGICATDPTNMSLAAGFALDKLWTPQGAFLFEAEFVAGKLGASETPDYHGTAFTFFGQDLNAFHVFGGVPFIFGFFERKRKSAPIGCAKSFFG